MAGTLKRLATALIFLLAPFFLLAQEISDFSYQLFEGKIEINYTLSGESSDLYEVKLYSSLDDFTAPLKLLSGDVGMDIIPGGNKKITWDAKAELGEFKGNLSLKLKTRFVPFITFDIAKGAKFKRGKSQDLSWESGKSVKVNLELYQGNNKVTDINIAGSSNTYNWLISKKMPLGDDYKIKASANGRFAFSESFSIKRKVPIILWIIPAAAVIGGTVAIIAGSGNGNGNEDNSIPEPIGPN